MPTFDVVSEVDTHELRNAVDQANREINNRFDLKGSSAKFELDQKHVKITADAEFQANQLKDILIEKLIKRSIDPKCADIGEVQAYGKVVHLTVGIREGIEAALARKVVKIIKASKLKVQTAIQGEKLRITGKKRDILQQTIALIKSEALDWPLQFNNFRD
jgi:uncharacterized protein YajQ (UPF0234 family)